MECKDMAERYARFVDEFHKREDGIIMWTCEHGVEHPVWFGFAPIIRHSCDGCCKRLVRVDTSPEEEFMRLDEAKENERGFTIREEDVL